MRILSLEFNLSPSEATITHAVFIARVISEVTRQLQTLACTDFIISDFARQIHWRGSTNISFPDGYGRHDPDDSFGHKLARYSGVILEGSCSQKRKYLGRLADDYILGSNGSVRVVVGLDFENRDRGKGKGIASKVATLSLWRPKLTVVGDGPELSEHQEAVNMVR